MGILALSGSTGHYGANKQTLHMGCCFVSAANVCSTVSRNLSEEDMRQEQSWADKSFHLRKCLRRMG